MDRLLLTSMCHILYGQTALRSLLWLCRSLGARMVAECVETERGLVGVKAAGIDLVQGFLLGEPRPVPLQAAGGGQRSGFWHTPSLG